MPHSSNLISSASQSSLQKTPVLILAGGLGTRISEETVLKPKPMIEIGDIPILVHLMRWYYSFGFNDFVICAGYRAWEIKQYFLNYPFRKTHLIMDHRQPENPVVAPFGSASAQERWRVRVVDTGANCGTGGRVARALDEISQTDDFTDFALTYGDGLSDVRLDEEWLFHRTHGRVGTVLGVAPMARFGELDVNAEGRVQDFSEKPQSRQGLINGGFFFFKKEFRGYLDAREDCTMEGQPVVRLSRAGQLMVHRHTGFWHPMDTLRDKNFLQELWNSGKAPWVSRPSADAS